MGELKKQRAHYGAIEGLRAYSAIGIILMHVFANGNYAVKGFVFERAIPSFGELVFLFMTISGFSMCCGYYDKIINNKISVSEFYNKRYAKIWPFFAFLCVVDFLVSPSIDALYEVFANITLCFGLLPDADISVIGVGWFLGVVFVFYLVFPFFCYLLLDKKRAWLSLAVALVLNYLCTVRFDADRTNIIYSAEFFLSGGLIFIYKETLSELAERYHRLLLAVILLVIFIYYAISNSTQVMLVLFSAMLIYALRNSAKTCILYNPFTRFCSGISMEIYLSHMVVFRVFEKIGLIKLFHSDMISFLVVSVATIIGAVVFSLIIKNFLVYLGKYINANFISAKNT